MSYFILILGLILIGVSIFYLVREWRNSKEKNKTTHSVLKNKKQIEKTVNNIESMIVLADGNDNLCNRLVELKEQIKFLNPTNNSKVILIDTKIANRLDDMKIELSKDNQAETNFRMLEEVEGLVATRVKEEQSK